MFSRIFSLYYDGFRSMTLGRTLWVIIIIKLFVMFVVMRLLFFPNFLGERFDSDKQKSDYVGIELIERGSSVTNKE